MSDDSKSKVFSNTSEEYKILKPDYIQTEVSLKNFNTWKTGGAAKYLVLPETLDQYKESIAWALSQNLPLCFLGQGSNVLISDDGFPGLVLCSKKFQQVDVISEDPNLILRCDSGALKFKVMRQFLKYNLSPALFLSGIPGDVGGGVVMNAGVGENIQPREFCEIVKSIKVLSWTLRPNSNLNPNSTSNSISEIYPTSHVGLNSKPNLNLNSNPSFEIQFEIKEFNHSEIEWFYRSSKNWQPGFIFEVTLTSPRHEVPDLAEKVKVSINNRKLKQPWDKPSCGSVFVNPPNHKSGQLIESLGLKGFKIGGAQVSYKHANFIVNTGSATSQDLHQVIEHVKAKVLETYKVSLHTEVVYLGPWTHIS